ncbi:hypothetical protein EMMF5_003364 [Cystobasidiomycetes sp. EMM_F5]
MPYVSPALSPAKAFASVYPSPPGSAGPSSPTASVSGGAHSNGGYSSPTHPRSRSGSASLNSSAASSPMHSRSGSSNSIEATYAAHCAPHMQNAVQTSSTVDFSPAYTNGFPASTSQQAKRPTHRHHNRSHSSDTLVSMGSISTKQTPGYIFVQPASPQRGVDSHSRYSSTETVTADSTPSTTPSSSTSSSVSSLAAASSSGYRTSFRPPSRNNSSSRLAYPTSPPNNAGDDGDVAPPRTSRSRRARLAVSEGGTSLGSTSGSGTVSADHSPRASLSMNISRGVTSGGEPAQSPFTLPLPDLDAMSPPAFANRSSSSPNLSTLGLDYTTAKERPYSRLNPSPSASPRHSPSLAIPMSASDYYHYQPSRQFHEQQLRSGAWDSVAEESEDGEQTPRAEARYGSSGILGDNADEGSPTQYVRATDLPPNDSALATSSESPSSASSDAGSDDDRISKHLETRLGRPSPSLASARFRATNWGQGGAPAMDSPVSFSFARSGSSSSSSSTGGNTPPNDEAAYPDSANGETGSETERERENATPMSTSTIPTSGPFAPGSNPNTARIRRPQHTKAFSERATGSPKNNATSTNKPNYFRLELEGAGPSRTPFPSYNSTPMGHGPSASEGGESRRGSKQRPPGLPTPMLRKKSGELVKSSLKHDSRAKSAPTTPTGPKAVHFDEQLERVKHFLAQQRPLAVSRDGSPQETETEDDSEAAFPFPPMTTSIPAQIQLVLPDFPNNTLPEIGHRDLCLETLEIAADSKSLKGTALLRNICFEKRLSIRFTFDDWQTVSEVTGEWTSTLVGGSLDRWAFTIKLQDMLARIEEKKMYIALRYSVGGRDIWDSNNGNNYRAEFRKQPARSQAVVGGSRAARHEWSVTNSGQASERMNDLRRELDRLVAEQDDFASGDEVIVSRGIKRYIGQEALVTAQPPSHPTFASRYDFGASLKEAGARNSPQTNFAILDNPYFAASGTSATATGGAIDPHAAWKPNPSPTNSLPTSGNSSPPKGQYSALYAGVSSPPLPIPGVDASFSTTPPASFSGQPYYARMEHNGVIATDFGLPNSMTTVPASFMNAMGEMTPTATSVGGVVGSVEDSPYLPASDLPPVSAQFLGGEALSRQDHGVSVPTWASASGAIGTSRILAHEATSLLEPSLDDKDPLDPSLYSPAVSAASGPSPADSPIRRASPPPRPGSPEDLLSPSPSSASTDTSISTPQSPNGSPPLRLFPMIDGGGRPDMGSDTYFNFVHRCELTHLQKQIFPYSDYSSLDCWGNGEVTSPSQVSSSSTSTALGLAGMHSYEATTPRGSTPSHSCSASLLSSPPGSAAGSRTPSPVHGSPALDSNGFMYGPRPVQI